MFGYRAANGVRSKMTFEGVQHRATRMVPGLSKLNYEQRLKLMDLPPCVIEGCEATLLKYTST